jgi:hypothetical protein
MGKFSIDTILIVIIIIGVVGGLYFYNKNRLDAQKEMYKGEEMENPQEEIVRINYQIRKNQQDLENEVETMKKKFESELEQIQLETDADKREVGLRELTTKLDDELEKAKKMIVRSKQLEDDYNKVRVEYEKKKAEVAVLEDVVMNSDDPSVQGMLERVMTITDEYELMSSELETEYKRITDLAKIITKEVLEIKKLVSS